MGVKIPVGTANPSLPIYCRALTGEALTGKVAADFTDLWYAREGGAKVSVDPAGISEVAGGEYRKAFPSAAAAEGANYVTIGGEVSGGVVLGIPIALDVATESKQDIIIEKIDLLSVGEGAGEGADDVTMVIAIDGTPVADAGVWISNDAAGENVVAGTLRTNSNGRVTFKLDHGSTYYLWMQKDGVNSIMGERFVAVRD